MSEIYSIEAEELNELVKKDKVVIIDVREPEEYNESHIEDAINIPMNDVTKQQIEALVENDKRIILQCRSGKRSMTVAKKLQEQGFSEDMWNLEGGIMSWVANNFPIDR